MLRPRVHITYDVLRTLHADVPTFSTHRSLLTAHRSKAQRHEFRPSVVAMAERILITVWMISFQVSLFFIGSLVKGLVFSLFYFGSWLLYVMLKFAVKREQSQACLSYAEREQIEQS